MGHGHPVQRVPSQSLCETNGLGARIANQESLVRHPPDLVRTKAVDRLPVEMAMVLVDPDEAADVLQKHVREKIDYILYRELGNRDILPSPYPRGRA